jgi:hypothetical protein
LLQFRDLSLVTNYDGASLVEAGLGGVNLTGSWSFRLMDVFGSAACHGSEVFAGVVGGILVGVWSFAVFFLELAVYQ